MEKTIKVLLKEGAKLPTYMTIGSAGADLYAYLTEPFTLRSGTYSGIPTGLSIELPTGYEAQIRPRSGLALKHGITVLNSPGTIDSDYRGEIIVVLINHSTEDYTIENGDRIAQLVLSQFTQATFSIEDSLSSTGRDKKGFGHSGK